MVLRFLQKLALPQPTRPLVNRTTLLQQLNAATAGKRVIALAAPAGWGKTTALVQWAAQTELPVVWYSLDSADVDPRTFLDYLLHAAERLVPEARGLASRLADAPAEALPQLYHAAALAIAAVNKPFAFVFDDFHIIRDEPDAALPGTTLILSLLASIAEYAPHCRLVFASRTVPAFHGMVRLLAQQRAAVFDYTTLRFMPTDVQQLAGLSSGVFLSDERAETLTSQFGGWVTGLVLSLDQAVHADGETPPDLATDATPVYAFFAEQIITPLPLALQRFLEETSVLDDLSPQRCNALRDSSDAAQMLDEVRRHGLFVSSRAGWLAYHSLFRDFLLARLARDPQRYRMLFLRAGDLYRHEDDLERAIACFLEAGAELDAIALLQAAVPRFRQRSRQTTLLACFERLSHYRTERYRMIEVGAPGGHDAGLLPAGLLLAQARVFADLALWERAYLAVELAEAIGDPQQQIEAYILHAELCCVQGNHEQAAAALAGIAVEPLPATLQLDYYFTSGRMLLLRGELSAAITALEQAHALGAAVPESADDPSTIATLADMLGWAYAVQGDRPTALRHLKRADACWQACGNKGSRTVTLNNLAMIAMEEGRYGEARSALETGLVLAQETGRRREEVTLRCSLAELDILEHDLDTALTRLAEAHTLAVRVDLPGSIATAAAGALWAAALQGNSALAQAWLDVASSCDTAAPELRGRVALGHALLLLLQPHPDLALAGDLTAVASASESALGMIERAYLALLRGTLTFRRVGWPRAAKEWESFVQLSEKLDEAVLLCFAAPHRAFFDAAAAQGQPLAERLLAQLQAPQSHRWRVTALGNFCCLVDGVPVEFSQLHRALLVRLLDAGPEGMPVEQLWEDVWGDDHLSMPALRQALYRIRMATSIDLGTRDGNCAIRSGWETLEYDVCVFERALDQPAGRETLQRATALYRGAFLLSAPLSAALWADRRRNYLQQRYLDALEHLAQSVEADSPAQAIQYYQQVLQIDGCREHTAARLMRLAARFGQRSLVSATFEHLKTALRLLGSAPEPATLQLYQQLH